MSRERLFQGSEFEATTGVFTRRRRPTMGLRRRNGRIRLLDDDEVVGLPDPRMRIEIEISAPELAG